MSTRLHRLLNACRAVHVGRRSGNGPTPTVLTLASPDAERPILVGRPAGQAWAKQVGLDRLNPNDPVVIRRDPAVYAVSSSFWLGAFTPRILAAGSLPEFRARHRLELNAQDQDGLTLCVLRVLTERALSRPSWWQRRSRMA